MSDDDEVPDWVASCDHMECDDESVTRGRLCRDCVPIMRAHEPDTCPTCGTTIGPSE
jgi:hypothetical protein